MKFISKDQPRVCVDLDGVIFPGGKFKHILSLDHAPRPGAIHWLERISRAYEILIFTSRLCEEDHPRYVNEPFSQAAFDFALRGWFLVHGMDPDILRDRVQIVPAHVGKPAVDVYVDDHAYRYEGGAFPEAIQLASLHDTIYWRESPATTGSNTYQEAAHEEFRVVGWDKLDLHAETRTFRTLPEALSTHGRYRYAKLYLDKVRTHTRSLLLEGFDVALRKGEVAVEKEDRDLQKEHTIPLIPLEELERRHHISVNALNALGLKWSRRHQAWVCPNALPPHHSAAAYELVKDLVPTAAADDMSAIKEGVLDE